MVRFQTLLDNTFFPVGIPHCADLEKGTIKHRALPAYAEAGAQLILQLIISYLTTNN